MQIMFECGFVGTLTPESLATFAQMVFSKDLSSGDRS